MLAALTLTAMRRDPYMSHPVPLIVASLLHPASLSQNPLVRAMMSSAYELAPKALAYLVTWASSAFSVSPGIPILSLKLLLWAGQAVLMFRLGREVAGNEEAGFLAALFTGAEMPFVLADAPSNIQDLRRVLCMPAFLWGVLALLRGRRWQALAAFSISTYLHATPGIYAWPWMFLEDAIAAWRRPACRRGFWLRLAAAAAAALPLLVAVGGKNLIPSDADFVRMGIALHGILIAGLREVWADRVFLLEGAALVVLALWQGRRLAAAPILWRSLGVCLFFLAFGSASYHAYMARWPATWLWLMGARMQPWVSLYFFELTGQLALAAWLVERMREDAEAVPAILLMMALSVYHDFVLRLFCLGACVCLATGRRRAAVGLILSACALPFLYGAVPELFRRAAVSCGLRGGLFSLPAFNPATGLALAVALGLGFWLSRRSFSGRLHAACAAVVFLVVGGGLARANLQTTAQEVEYRRMAAWIRENTPPQAVILVSPLDLLDLTSGSYGGMDFMAAAERSVFACTYYGLTSIRNGTASAPMAENLKTLGMMFRDVREWADYESQMRRIDAALTPEQAARLASGHQITHILLRAGRPWPGPELHRAGSLALYRLAGS